METNNSLPLSLKIFAILYVIKNTIPILIVSLSKILDLNITTSFFKETLPSLSMAAAKMVNTYDYTFQATIMPLVLSIITLVTLFLLITNKLKLVVFQNKGTFTFLKVIVSLNVIMIILTSITGTGDQSGTLSAAINWLLTLALTVSFMIYVFSSKTLRKFFTAPK